MIGQFAVVDESKDNTARVNLSRTKRIVFFDVDIVATELTITVDDKRTDHVKPLPSCLNIEKEDFFRLLQNTFFPEYFYSETYFTVLKPVANDIVVEGSTGQSTEMTISSLRPVPNVVLLPCRTQMK